MSHQTPIISRFFNENPIICAVTQASRGLVGYYFDVGAQTNGLLFTQIDDECEIRILTEPYVRGINAITAAIHGSEFFAATTSKGSNELILWRLENINSFASGHGKVLLQLDYYTEVLTFGTICDQLVLAVGQRNEVIIIPITEGILRDVFQIPEEATALVFTLDGTLLVGTIHGVIAIRLYPDGRE